MIDRLASTKRPARRRRGSRRRGGALLEVRVRAATARRNRARRVSAFLVSLVLWGSVAISGYYAFKVISTRFFLENPEYRLRHVKADLDGLLTMEAALEVAGIRIGDCIFTVDLARAERELRKIQQIAHVSIQRVWPDTLSIRIRQHRPVAWLTGESSNTLSADTAWLVTESGHCMRPYTVAAEYWSLPVVYTASPEKILAKDPLAMADLRAALDLLRQANTRSSSAFRIRSMNISKGYAIDVLDPSGTKILFSAEDFGNQLDRLDKLLAHTAETGRQIESVNLIPRKYTAVRFVMAAASEPPTAVPTRETQTLRQ